MKTKKISRKVDFSLVLPTLLFKRQRRVVWLILGVGAVYLKDLQKEEQMPQPIQTDESGALSKWKGRHYRDNPKSQHEYLEVKCPPCLRSSAKREDASFILIEV